MSATAGPPVGSAPTQDADERRLAEWWLISAKNTFTGPRHTVSELDAELGETHTAGPPAAT